MHKMTQEVLHRAWEDNRKNQASSSHWLPQNLQQNHCKIIRQQSKCYLLPQVCLMMLISKMPVFLLSPEEWQSGSQPMSSICGAGCQGLCSLWDLRCIECIIEFTSSTFFLFLKVYYCCSNTSEEGLNSMF